MARAAPYDAIVLDVMLPGIDGFATCRELRARGVWTPVLMLTARDAIEDRIEGLDTGADDYLVKPFAFSELLARLRALARRAPSRAARPSSRVGDLRLDPATHRAWRGETELELTAKEFVLLEVFMRRPGEVLSRVQLLDAAWDIAFESHSNVVDVYVRYLREKIDRPFGRTLDRDGSRRRVPAAQRNEPHSDPDPPDTAVRARDGGRARGARRIRLRAGRLDAPPLDRPEPARAGDGGDAPARQGALAARPRRRERGELRPGARRGRALVSARDRPARPAARRRRRRGRSPAAARSARPSSIPGRDGPLAAARDPALVAAAATSVLVLASSLDARDESLERPAQGAARRLAARAAARDARRLRARRRGAAPGRGDAAQGERDLGGDAGQPAAGAARRATRSRGSPRRSTRCSTGSRPPSSTSVASSPTRATSCARRSRSSAPSSSSRSAIRARARSSRTRSARPPRRPTG